MVDQKQVDSMAESADTANDNAIGNFRPTKLKDLHQIESVGTYRPESAIGMLSPTDLMAAGMESRML